MPEPEDYTLYDVVVAVEGTTAAVAALETDLANIKTNVANLWNLFNRVLAMPRASTLISEYFGNEDLDNNGLIFGYDFYITNPPKMLESIEFDTTPASAMTWEEYLES